MTLAPPLTSPPRYGPPPPRARRFSVGEYHKLIADGFFSPNEQFELLEGWIVEKVSRNPPHDASLNRARRRIERVLPPRWMVRVQSAVTTPDSEPEPDIAVVRGDDGDYESRHPAAADVALLVEVANTTLADDGTTKLRVYARAAFERYWILNLTSRTVETHAGVTSVAGEPAYADRVVYAAGQAVPLVIGGVEVDQIPVVELLG